MRREIKFKKLMFSELPSDFILFKQYNITSANMFQNLLALHAVDLAHQDTISVEVGKTETYSLRIPLGKCSVPNLKRLKGLS